MNNFVMRNLTLGSIFQPLSPTKLVASVTISAPPTNAGGVIFQGDTGQDVVWLPGEWHDFTSIDLSKVKAKGTPGDVLTIVGGTW